jgi:glycosyltransferase involved in cell wall biosynthesis
MEKKNLKVVHVLRSLMCGGVQTMALRLIRGLMEKSFSQVVLYQVSTPGDMRSEFAKVVDVRYCPYRPGGKLKFLSSCSKMLREEAPDVLLAHAFGNHALVGIAARLSGVSRTYVIAAADPIHTTKSWWRAFALAHLGRPLCQGEIAVSESVRKILADDLRLPRRRSIVIPNSCEVRDLARRAEESRSNRYQSNHWTVLMVSRMDRLKDHPTLLHAVQLLKARGRPVQLILAGDGPLRKEQEALTLQLGLSDSVTFLGNRTDVAELMGASDVLVLATYSEGLPTVLLEGMAAGIPVVATDIPPCREVLDGGRCGILAPPQDPGALATAIESLLEDAHQREGLVSAARERARDCYDLPLMVDRYARLLLAN